MTHTRKNRNIYDQPIFSYFTSCKPVTNYCTFSLLKKVGHLTIISERCVSSNIKISTGAITKTTGKKVPQILKMFALLVAKFLLIFQMIKTKKMKIIFPQFAPSTELQVQHNKVLKTIIFKISYKILVSGTAIQNLKSAD